MEKYGILFETGIAKYKKRIFLFAGAGFFIGIFVANTFGKSAILELGIFGDYFFMQMKNVKIKSNSMFLYVFEKRMVFILAIMLFSVTSFGICVVYITAGWMGISVGMLLSAAAMQQGIEGIAMCMAGMLPHYLFYVPAGIVFLIKSCQFSGRMQGKEHAYQSNIKRDMTTYVLISLGVFIVFFLGVLLESLLNPFFLEKIYEIFNNML